jgi:hypothetical protein
LHHFRHHLSRFQGANFAANLNLVETLADWPRRPCYYTGRPSSGTAKAASPQTTPARTGIRDPVSGIF